MSVMYSIVSHVGAAGHGLDACFILSDRGTWVDVLDVSVHARAMSPDARACLRARACELFHACPSACGLRMARAPGEPAAPEARAECALRAGSGPVFLGRPPRSPPHPTPPLPTHLCIPPCRSQTQSQPSPTCLYGCRESLLVSGPKRVSLCATLAICVYLPRPSVDVSVFLCVSVSAAVLRPVCRCAFACPYVSRCASVSPCVSQRVTVCHSRRVG